MKKFSLPQSQFKQHSTIKCTFFPERQILTPKTPISPIILKQQLESQSGGKQDGRLTMDHLCKVFLERFGSKRNCQFDAKQLVQVTGVKQRRIYDLMNILEGCGFMKRLSKGKYIWFNFEKPQIQIAKKGRKKQATSLSNLAARVKDLLYNSQDYIDFKDICQQIIQDNYQIPPNQDSIKRRVYECCKILKILGIIIKKGQAFKWATQKERDNTVNKGQGNKKVNQDDWQTKGKQIVSIEQKMNSRQLISQLLEDVQNEQQFQNLLDKMRQQFSDRQKKNQFHLNPKRLFTQN